MAENLQSTNLPHLAWIIFAAALEKKVIENNEFRWYIFLRKEIWPVKVSRILKQSGCVFFRILRISILLSSAKKGQIF